MKFRHKKRGTEYVVLAKAKIQISTEPLELHEDDTVIVYKSLKDGDVWVRRVSEFFDGRFEVIKET